ncbi:MAG: hypothetical protein HZA20_10100 [Nitrospirae bacterium]|nr:hypothetical protein [Nitrospirota bacterium]
MSWLMFNPELFNNQNVAAESSDGRAILPRASILEGMPIWCKVVIVQLIISAIYLVENHFILTCGMFYIEENDLLFQYLPEFFLLQKSLHSGFVPVWTDIVGSGFPLAGYGQNALLHPLQLMVAWFIPDPLVGLKSMLFMITFTGSLVFVLSMLLIGIDDIVLLIYGAVAYHFSFFFMYKGYSLILSFIMAPMIVALLYKLSIESDSLHKKTFLFGVLGGISLLALYAPFQLRFFLVVYACAVFMILIVGNRRLYRIGLVSFACLMAVVIAYPQFKLTYELVKVGDIKARGLEFLLDGSSPFGLWNYFANYSFSRDPIIWSMHSKWNNSDLLPPVFFLSIFSLYNKSTLTRFLWCIVAVSFFMALGKYNPVYVFMARHGMTLDLRIPARFLFMFNFTFPVLAMIGLNQLRHLGGKAVLRVIVIYLLAMCIVNLMAAMIIDNMRDAYGTNLKMYTHYYSDFYDTKIYNRNKLSAIVGIVRGASWNLDFLKLYLSTFSAAVFATVIMVAMYAVGRFNHRKLVLAMSCLLIFEGLALTMPKNSESAKMFNEYYFPAKFNGVSKIAALEEDRIRTNIRSSLNMVYDIAESDTYNASLYISKYKDYLNIARVKASNSDYEYMKYIGVDGILTRQDLSNYIWKRDVGDGFSLYKVSDKENVVWYPDGNSFRPVENCRIIRKNPDWTIDLTLPEGAREVVVFRNYFKGFNVYVNGEHVRPDLYYSFYRFRGLRAGRNTIEIKWSWPDLLL